MPCIALPIPTVAAPSLPSPFTFGASTPSLSFNPNLCCKIAPPFSLPSFSASIPINAAAIAVIMQAVGVVTSFLRTIPLDCPRELQDDT